MAEENLATETDIFQQQKKTIETLQDVLVQKQALGPQIVYASPSPEPTTKSPNYVMWIGIGLGFLILTRKVKL